MKTIRDSLIGQVVVLVAMVLVETVFSVSVILSLVVMVGLAVASSIGAPRSQTGKRKLKTILILVNLLVLSIFFLNFSHQIDEYRESPRLPLPYKEIGDIAYFLMFLLVIVLIIAIPIFTLSWFTTRREVLNPKNDH